MRCQVAGGRGQEWWKGAGVRVEMLCCVVCPSLMLTMQHVEMDVMDNISDMTLEIIGLAAFGPTFLESQVCTCVKEPFVCADMCVFVGSQ